MECDVDFKVKAHKQTAVCTLAVALMLVSGCSGGNGSNDGSNNGSSSQDLEAFVISTDGTDVADSMAHDPNSGDLFVAGYTTGASDRGGSSGEFDASALLTRVSQDGEARWLAAYDSLGETAYGVAVDSPNQVVYLAGTDIDSSRGAFLAKVNFDGEAQWSVDLEDMGYGYVRDVYLDSDSGQVYVAGAIEQDVGDHSFEGGESDAILAAFDETGSTVDHIVFGASDSEYFTHIERAPNGDWVLHGLIYEGGIDDEDTVDNPGGLFIMRFSESGEQLWGDFEPGYDAPNASCLSGNCKALDVDTNTGEIYNVQRTTDPDVDPSQWQLVTRDPDGNVLRESQLFIIGIAGLFVRSVEVDEETGDVWLTGQDGNGNNVWYGKVDAEGELVLDESFLPSGNLGSINDAVVIQQTQRVFMAGQYVGFGSQGQPPNLPGIEGEHSDIVLLRGDL